MMSDTRLAMREFRFLDEKRKLTTLSSSEEQRWRELKQALGTPQPNIPSWPAVPSTAGHPDPASAFSAEGSGEPMATDAVPPHYAPYNTPGYGQLPAAPLEDPPPAPPRRSENSSLPAAKLPELPKSPAPAAPTAADTNPAAGGKVEPSSVSPGQGVIELDSNEVTLLDAVEEEPALEQPRIAAKPQDEGVMIDLSASEAIDTGEFKPVEAPPLQPAPQPPAAAPAPPPPAPVEVRSQPAVPAFTQPPIRLEPQRPGAGRGVVRGEHRVIIHTHEGQVKRGTTRDPDVWGNAIALEQSGQSEQVPTEQIKAIFFMKAAGGSGSAASGQKIRVTLADGRQVLGFSTDFQSEAPGFFLVPADVRTNTSRIYLFRSAVEAIDRE
jgi:hypothetical protein